MNNKIKKYLPGEKFGSWKVIKEAEKSCGQRRVVVRCNCGYEKEAFTSMLPKYKKNNSACKKCKLLDKDLSFKKFGELLVLKRVRKNNHNHWLYLCQCDCGNKKEVLANSLISGRTVSCGHTKNGSKNHNWKGFEKISGEYWSTVKRNAKIRNIGFNISFEDVWSKYEEQDRKCALTGLPIEFPEKRGDTKHKKFTIASIDRIDSNKNYSKNNIQLVLYEVNMMKQSLAQEDFIEICELIVENKKNWRL